MVEGARLESVCRFTPTVGSNPTLSATRSREGEIAHVGKYFLAWTQNLSPDNHHFDLEAED